MRKTKKYVLCEKKIKKIKVKLNKTIDGYHIKPRNKIGSLLVFDKAIARKSLKYGYNDTMKVYNKLEGNKYTFKKRHLEKNYFDLGDDFVNTCKNFLNHKNGVYDRILKLSVFNKLINSNNKQNVMKILNDNLEYLGKIYGIDDTSIYSVNRYNRILRLKLNESESISVQYINKKIKNKDFKELLNSKSIVKYIYNLMTMENNQKELLKIAYIFPKEFIGSLYLLVINKN